MARSFALVGVALITMTAVAFAWWRPWNDGAGEERFLGLTAEELESIDSVALESYPLNNGLGTPLAQQVDMLRAVPEDGHRVDVARILSDDDRADSGIAWQYIALPLAGGVLLVLLVGLAVRRARRSGA